MAGFKGTKWAARQGLYRLKTKQFEINPVDDKVFAISRSIHYGLFLAFEGIRFFARKQDGQLQLVFANLHKNLDRFRRSMAYNLGREQQQLVPGQEELEKLIAGYFSDEQMIPFVQEMADMGAQGYLRPFTADESMSIGVTFPEDPAIRLSANRYDSYLGEPFTGVIIPHLVRAVGVNGTGCLKLGVNYLMSVKAVDAAKAIEPSAGAALFLDDQPQQPIEERIVSEWDSSCCLFAFRDGSVVKIPENPLILPSVTINGICAILRQQGVTVQERHVRYGELLERNARNELVAVCSIGTAGILNRAERLIFVDGRLKRIAEHQVDKSHELYERLGQARQTYWDIYRGLAEPVAGIDLKVVTLR